MYFEEKLIDYDVCINYTNWNFVAGLGPGRQTKLDVIG